MPDMTFAVELRNQPPESVHANQPSPPQVPVAPRNGQTQLPQTAIHKSLGVGQQFDAII